MPADDLREVARMNIHRVRSPLADGHGYIWTPDGEARWRALHELLDRLQQKHRINDRVGLEDAVADAAAIYHHPGALPRADVKRLLTSISKIMKVLREENDGRIASIVMDRDKGLIKGRAWNKSVSRKRIGRMLMLESKFLFNPVLPRTELHRRVDRHTGLFDGWEYGYERALAVRMRLSRIRSDLGELASALGRLPEGREGDMKLHGAVKLLEERWKSLPGMKVGKANFVQSVMAFIADRGDINAVVKSAMRHRLKGL